MIVLADLINIKISLMEIITNKIFASDPSTKKILLINNCISVLGECLRRQGMYKNRKGKKRTNFYLFNFSCERGNPEWKNSK